MPDSPAQPDPVAAYLSGVHERWDTAENAVYATLLGRAQALTSLADIPRLLGAVEAVLALHKGHPHEDYPQEQAMCQECGEWSPCPTEAVITRELLKEVPADGR